MNADFTTRSHANTPVNDQGDAWTLFRSLTGENPCQVKIALQFACVAIDVARTQLDGYALATDDPLPGVVNADDLLDAAGRELARALAIVDNTGGVR